ncbi:MAG TPA: M20/M25/M40 family metallo-hydrolase, partial [Acidimicrobiales bacterium]
MTTTTIDEDDDGTGPKPVGRGPAWLDRWLDEHGDDLVALRRQIHSRPELGYAEHETTALVGQQLTAAGLAPRVLPGGTGAICDVGAGPRTVALRADIDALPLTDAKDVPYRSTVEGVCHACGHDAHTA